MHVRFDGDDASDTGPATKPYREIMLIVECVVAQSCVKELCCLRMLGGGMAVRFVPYE
jgi:hypothetical protein